MKRVADLRQCATEQNALRLLDVTCFRRLDDSDELCPLRRLEEFVAKEPYLWELGLQDGQVL